MPKADLTVRTLVFGALAEIQFDWETAHIPSEFFGVELSDVDIEERGMDLLDHRKGESREECVQECLATHVGYQMMIDGTCDECW